MLIWQSNTRNSIYFLFFPSVPDSGQLELSFTPLSLRPIELMFGYFWKPAEFKQLLKVSGFSLHCYVWRDAKKSLLAKIFNLTS